MCYALLINCSRPHFLACVLSRENTCFEYFLSLNQMKQKFTHSPLLSFMGSSNKPKICVPFLWLTLPLVTPNGNWACHFFLGQENMWNYGIGPRESTTKFCFIYCPNFLNTSNLLRMTDCSGLDFVSLRKKWKKIT